MPQPNPDDLRRASTEALLERHVGVPLRQLNAELMTEVAERIAAAVAELDTLVAQHEQYRTPWTDSFDVCTACTRGMELVPWPCDTRQRAARIRRTLTGEDHHDAR